MQDQPGLPRGRQAQLRGGPGGSARRLARCDMRIGFLTSLPLLFATTVASAQTVSPLAADSRVLTPTVPAQAPVPLTVDEAPGPISGAAAAPLIDFGGPGTGGPDRFWVYGAYV